MIDLSKRTKKRARELSVRSTTGQMTVLMKLQVAFEKRKCVFNFVAERSRVSVAEETAANSNQDTKLAFQISMRNIYSLDNIFKHKPNLFIVVRCA